MYLLLTKFDSNYLAPRTKGDAVNWFSFIFLPATRLKSMTVKGIICGMFCTRKHPKHVFASFANYPINCFSAPIELNLTIQCSIALSLGYLM